MTAPNYWCVPSAELMRDLGSSREGLSQQEAAARLIQSGPNSLNRDRRTTAAGLLFAQFRNPLLLVLVAAAVVSAFVGEWVDAGIVLTVVAGSALLSFYQEYAATRAMEALQSRIEAKATVIRDGVARAVSAETVVPGDVISLTAGSLIAADAVLLDARDFFVNQAVLTGETFPAEKVVGVVPEDSALAERTNTVFLGTSVRSGTARALVVRTGTGTAFGQIAERLKLRPPETSFERGIRSFGYLLTKVMLVLVTAVFAINVFNSRPPVDSLLFAIALAVGLAPELLPAILTITLAHGAQRMAKRGVIVRRLSAIENLGSMNVLCTDKTGTLTEGVVRLDGALSPDGQSSEEVLRLAFWNAHFQTGLPNPLDEAIVQSAPETLSAGCTKTDEIPYDFVRRRLSVVVERNGTRTLVTKGALDNVLAVCREIPAQAPELFANWSSTGARVLGVASRSLEPGETAAEKDLEFAGFLLFFDSPKAGVGEVIDGLTRSGIDVKMISGDNRLVAAHVARKVGLPSDALLTGGELQQMSEEALWQRAKDVSVFAEVDPNQKERIIRALQKTGHTVGYMGDGINDAPALHAADVGISVESAVDVAKESADFVLLEQDLKVLRQGIEEGRRTFANTLKYIFTTTSANFGNMLSMAGASLFLPFLPLLAKQILLNNFLSDIPGMAIASDNVDSEWIQRPHRWDITYIRNFMVIFGLVSSFFDYVTFGVLLWVMQASEQEFRTGWFVESVLTELAVAMVVRTRLPFYSSRPSGWLVCTTLVVASLTLTLPYLPGASALGFIPLPGRLLVLVIGITTLYVLAAETAKHYFHRHAAQLAGRPR